MMNEQVKIGDKVNYNAVSGDWITYSYRGAVIEAVVTQTTSNVIYFETTDGRRLHASYEQLWAAGTTYMFVRPKNALPKFYL